MGWSKDLGPTEWAGRLSADFFLEKKMSELSIFVDESGDFGKYAKHSPFYVLTMVFHDQSIDISEQIKHLNDDLKNMGYENTALHTEPLIRREEIYRNVEPNERRSLFTRLYYFTLHSDIQYKSFLYKKIRFEGEPELETRMTKDILSFIQEHLAYFQSFDKIIIYYDNGQVQITRILNSVMATLLNNYEMRKVIPINYRLFQAADLICTLSVLQQRYDSNSLTRSDLLMFRTKKDLNKDFLKRIKAKEFKT